MDYEDDAGELDEDALFDRADDERARRKEVDAEEFFAAQAADRAAEQAAGIELDDKSRHVLIVEDTGWTYVAPHADPSTHPYYECERIGRALRAFRGDYDGDDEQPSTMAPGRYWCSADADGNFEIGGRVVDTFTATAEVGKVVPPELCGYVSPDTGESCVLLPHVGTGGRHSWEA